MSKHYLFYVEQPYSFAILRPLQDAIRANGAIVKWFLKGQEVASSSLRDDELELTTVEAVKAFNPRAVFVPGNVVPDFFPRGKSTSIPWFGVQKERAFWDPGLL